MSTIRLPALLSNAALWLGGFAAVLVLLGLLLSGYGNLVVALIGTILFGLLVISNKPVAALTTMAYLLFMGDLRRLRDLVLGHPSADLFLLVGPTVAALLALPVFYKIRLRDRVSVAMLLLLVVMVLEIANPTQGGLGVGLGGALFLIVPMLWFWIGQQLGTPAVLENVTYKVLLPIGTAAALFGLYQTYFGFPAYQKAWIDSNPINARLLDVGHGALRAIGFSTSAAEYGNLLGMTAAAAAAAAFGKRRLWVLAFPVAAAAVVLSGGRGSVLRLVLAISLIWALRKGTRLKARTVLQLGLALATVLGCVYLAASRFVPSDEGSGKVSSASAALAHQAGGLAHIGDQKYSDANLHEQMILGGIYQGFAYPIGHGLGYTTGAAGKFGGGGGSTEVDLSDMFVDLGFVGGLLYTFVILGTLWNAVQYIYTGPRGTALPVAGVLVVSMGAWALGGLYSIPAVTLFLAGAVSRHPQGLGRPKLSPAVLQEAVTA